MEYFFNFNTKSKDESILITIIYSIIFHLLLALAVLMFKPHPPEYIKITVATNSVQLNALPIQSSKQSVQKQVNKKITKEEVIKSESKKQIVQKEIPAEKSSTIMNAKDVPNPSPEAQSANETQEFYSAESTVDKTAQCTLPEITLTDDATNAGIRSGNIIIEVQINSQGKVTLAKLIKGTGYKIDQVALVAAKELNCKPARRDQQSVGVIKRFTWVILQ